MKTLNIIDLAVQTIILGIVLLLSLAVLIGGEFDSVAIIVMGGAMFLGPWQLVSSFITTLSKGLFLPLRRIHLLSSVAYLVVVGLIMFFANDVELGDLVETIFGAIFFCIPTFLAGFYYYITYRTFQTARALTRAQG